MSDSPRSDVEGSTLVKDADVAQDAQPHHGWLNRLYTGTGAFEVVGRRRFYYLLTGAIVLICLLSMVFRGFTLGIDFEGGTRIQLPAADNVSTEQVETVFSDTLGFEPVSVQTVGSGAAATVQVRSEALDAGQVDSVKTALFDAFQPVDGSGTATPNAISVSDVSETWGGQITQKALIALVVFLVIVSIYISIRYERDMALAALAALGFDLLVTAGVYSLVGFEVTPATVIGLLTILGFSLYDSVVVFDKVEENTRGILHLNRKTYAEQANLAVNQTLMRSINTTVIGVLPVLALMIVAVWLLGVGTLKDLALVQLVGMIVGAYSSIFFATPLLVTLKEKWGPVAAHTRKVLAKRAEAAQRGGGATPAVAVASKAPASVTPTPGSRPTGKRNKKRR
ncbi:protein translocase subunit SecF [Rhodococcus sp. BP-252]|uniref:Protein-export membrane protein SecF n=1 Tax=Rhodococcoides kyotonense TaxID=398843 RepID=A0A177YFK5_9NOCA|nr:MULTISPECIES: protein translocase subunit SecF [Rhodococcus]MBY6414475.1 protein translocase subunit SecF [Rhodococcus sp. BP-320]MBY6419215.1 protein translocase subunit SecF [Rhodococcus sp. BP-321]MBY6423942.1 protein translocase subunit SecF [Rhodococcus sp. BP-324]MBY6429324.1 protein translocase subunit SecF [Rhodococcus sp. BP-323]MBY6434285.1 protein translocase subunit SecF [Rhodococcus sp. BP-322]